MPPSGFSQEAINGLLKFVEAAYESTLVRYRGKSLSEGEHLEESIGYLEGVVKSTAPLAVNGTVSREGIEGLATFVIINYKDLINEINQSKKNEGQAIQTELSNISRYLAQFKLEEK
ncbi:hypothetical protein HYX11_01490 [Candidatus Woesearchaeota archaeon]|nr:hypothetical protein [Candidatus Woesearchaeota archaeon]